MKIVVRGYYGFGNLGDDLLCKVILEILHESWPKAELTVLSLASNPHYLHELTNFDIKVTDNPSAVEYDVLCYGGGGVFFDFAHGSMVDRFINGLIKVIGLSSYARLISGMRAGAPKALLHVGIGIGVGTFTNASIKFREKARQLGTLDQLFVRDDRSMVNLRELGFTGHVVRSTDLVFHVDSWRRATEMPRQQGIKSIAVVLRDWKIDESRYLDYVFEWLDWLRGQGYEIVLVSFDPLHDGSFIARRGDIHLLQWDPTSSSISQFIDRLNSFDAFITSRAHGAIIAGCLYKPALIIDLEPKLRTIHAMFPRSMALVGNSISVDTFSKCWQDYINSVSIERMQEDVESNSLLINSAVTELVHFIKSAL